MHFHTLPPYDLVLNPAHTQAQNTRQAFRGEEADTEQVQCECASRIGILDSGIHSPDYLLVERGADHEEQTTSIRDLSYVEE